MVSNKAKNEPLALAPIQAVSKPIQDAACSDIYNVYRCSFVLFLI